MNVLAASTQRTFRQVVVRMAVLMCALLPAAYGRAQVSVTNLITDDAAANAALITDPSLQNAWGISMSATGPFWVSDNATAVTTIYSVNPSTNAPVKQALTVTIPGDGSGPDRYSATSLATSTATHFSSSARTAQCQADGRWAQLPRHYKAQAARSLQGRGTREQRRQRISVRGEFSSRHDRRS